MPVTAINMLLQTKVHQFIIQIYYTQNIDLIKPVMYIIMCKYLHASHTEET